MHGQDEGERLGPIFSLGKSSPVSFKAMANYITKAVFLVNQGFLNLRL